MDVLTALLAGGVAAGYYTIAALIVPRIALADATPRFVWIFRIGGIAFFVGCGLTHTHIAAHALADDVPVAFHEAGFHLLQVFGVWAFIYAALRFLDVRVARRRTPEELESEALRERVDQLARSNEDLDQFAHVIAHDLKAPLQTVSGFAGLLERRYGEELPAPGGEWVHRIQDGTRRMSDLLDGVLEYSRAASQGLERRPVDVDVLMREVLAALDHMIDDYVPRITWEASGPVVADPVQLRQLLQNLVGNAIKFGDRDAPEVHVSVERATAGRRSPWPTTAAGSRPRTPRRSSRCSSAARAATGVRAPASDSPSAPRSPSATAGGSGPSRAPAAARACASRCPSR